MIYFEGYLLTDICLVCLHFKQLHFVILIVCTTMGISCNVLFMYVCMYVYVYVCLDGTQGGVQYHAGLGQGGILAASHGSCSTTGTVSGDRTSIFGLVLQDPLPYEEEGK